MKKIILLATAIVMTTSAFAQKCCNVVDGSGVTAISSNGVCIHAPYEKCPDTDGDGVLDTEDQCPTVPGTVNGCPDADKDGVIDSKDKCPTIAGTVNGCPDADGDGVIDSKDACPNVAGKFNGCPDSDGDGVADNKDKCPKVKGDAANNGCPWPDSDGDGIADKDDKCPNKYGIATEKGCPAKLTEEAKATLGKYAKTILFNSGRSTFKPGVSNTLDKVAGVMKEFKAVKFNIEGHTDSQGKDANNLALSQKRAQAVLDYLASHGIDGSRLRATGYGEVSPIATNKTAAGRAQNRRVVLTAVE